MRGALDRMRLVCTCSRIIPAYAGSTWVENTVQVPSEDHPRVCGEHYSQKCSHCGRKGSSPRMRGAPDPGGVCRPGRGIIPAYAGSTYFTYYGVTSGEDHPRVCGEHQRAHIDLVRLDGSSPRMRGAREKGMEKCRTTRIIPAYAGSTIAVRGSAFRV